MLLREELTSSRMVLLARGAGSLPAVGQSVVPPVLMLHHLSPVLLSLCATTSRLETKDKTLLNHTRSFKKLP